MFDVDVTVVHAVHLTKSNGCNMGLTWLSLYHVNMRVYVHLCTLSHPLGLRPPSTSCQDLIQPANRVYLNVLSEEVKCEIMGHSMAKN